MRTALFFLISMLTCLPALAASGDRAESPPCPQPLSGLIAAALAHTLVDAQDLPDFELVGRSSPVLIDASVDAPDCRITQADAPQALGMRYSVVNEGALQQYANQRGKVAFVGVNGAEIRDGGTRGTVHLGVAIKVAEKSNAALICCCGGEALFRKNAAGRWVFKAWGPVVCG